MSARVRYAMERFPDLAQTIKQCCADNRFFRGLCEDYGEAVEVLQNWEQVDASASSERLSTCRELIADLEQEILSELEHWNGG